MKHIISAFFVCIGAVAFAASPAATQQWVKYFTATNGAASMITESVATGGVTRVSALDGRYGVTLSIEDASVYALRATNVTASAIAYGITNDFTFVWRGETATNGIYKTGGETIYATKTNLVWRGIASTTNEVGYARFVNNFDVYRIKIQPSRAADFQED